MSFPRVMSSALIAVSLLCATAAQAADPPKEKSFGKAKPGGALLSRNELRECIAAQDRLKARREETLQLQAQLEKEKEEIGRRGTDLKDQLVWLDRTSQEQVEKYNGLAAERDKMIDAYQARSTSFNSQVDTLNADREAFGRSCENRRYDEKDEMAIKAGK